MAEQNFKQLVKFVTKEVAQKYVKALQSQTRYTVQLFYQLSVWQKRKEKHLPPPPLNSLYCETHLINYNI